MDRLRICVMGAGGRMGQALTRAIAAHDDTDLCGALERAGSPALGKNAAQLAGLEPGDITISPDVATGLEDADAVIDFTTPEATLAMLAYTGTRGLIHIIGGTGFNAEQDQTIAERVGSARIVKAGNMSLGVNLLMGLVKQAASALDPSFDIEIVEMHHRRKVDAPSGTALMLGEAVAAGRNISLADHSVLTRLGITGARERGTIGFATLRGGTVVGEHSVIFAGENERMELTHKAEDRSLFANGAITAALWARHQPPGLYSMQDVLGIKT
ncbi:MAG: 4-hydroxy-tetrahydrodipicolinate reductase [Alphaproteobacteria bacterium]|nr:4-hydroxy-tetrahydrodipicolinate reductase [Alphaproteobacteria bacterium]